jgi:hypothetical protein
MIAEVGSICRRRVAPVFDALLDRDATGADWLEGLLKLPQRYDGTTAEPVQSPGMLVEHRWEGARGGGEMRLDPPVELLRWLIEHPPAALGNLPASPGEPSDTYRRRQELAAGDPAARDDALQALAASSGHRRGWFVFEGPTSVDVYLATPNVIAVIEGKRTEASPTTKTEWMPVRHQLLRNIDAALEIAGERRVVGAFIIGATRDPAVPAEWQTATDATISPSALLESLPHRSEDERQQIADGYLGVTTWGAVVDALRLQADLLDD